MCNTCLEISVGTSKNISYICMTKNEDSVRTNKMKHYQARLLTN